MSDSLPIHRLMAAPDAPRLDAPAAGPEELRRAAAQFEALLMGQMLRQASQPLMKETLLDGSSASRMYRELFFEEISRLAVEKGGGFGITELLESRVRRPGEESES